MAGRLGTPSLHVGPKIAVAETHPRLVDAHTDNVRNPHRHRPIIAVSEPPVDGLQQGPHRDDQRTLIGSSATRGRWVHSARRENARIMAAEAGPGVVAWSCGVPDGGTLDGDTMLEHVARIVAAVALPVTADLEAGYGDTPDDVGRTVARAVEIGAVGANLEDAGKSGLFGIEEAVDRIAAARAAAPSGSFVLNARTDTYFAGTKGDVFAETVQRAVRYLEAGATASSCQASSNRTRFAGSQLPSPAPSTWWQDWRTPSTRPRSSRWASSASAWEAAWPEPRSARWSGPRAARLRDARLPRRHDRLRRPAATLRLVTKAP
jgi:hypothetical protein